MLMLFTSTMQKPLTKWIIDTKKLSLMAGFPFFLSYSVAFLRVQFKAIYYSSSSSMTCVLASTIRCFADDTRVCKAVSSCQDVSDLQKDLEHINTWSDCNNMMLHEDKFEYICHQANRSNLLLQLPFTSTYFEYHTLCGITLHPANNIRDLGVYISDDLSSTLHIATTCDKARQMAAWVFSVFPLAAPTYL